MAGETPKIDSRSLDDIVRQARSLAQEYVSMSSADYDKFMADETTDALIQIFARLVRIILQRLNKVPEKNFLAFLDLVGVQLSPPKAARAPLQFTLVEGSTTRGFVPAGTQVATAQTEEQPAVVFETAQNITVITPKVVKAGSVNPITDRYTDHSAYLTGEKTGTIEIFTGEKSVLHQLILGHDQIFGFKEPSTITLHVDLQKDFTEENAPWQPNDVEWYYYDVDEERISLTPKDTTNGLTKSGDMTLNIDKEVLRKAIAGVNKQNSLIKKTNHWIIAKLSTPIPSGDLPEIKNITANIVIAPEEPVNPDKAFTNNIPIDLSKDFYPFGERPKFNDTFYIASKEIFSKPNAYVTITVELSQGIEPPGTKNLKLIWEFRGEEKWEELGKVLIEKDSTNPEEKRVTVESAELEYGFIDLTEGFTKSGTISFNCPAGIVSHPLNGEENYWLRVRIIDGDYGQEASYEEGPMPGPDNSAITVYTYKPPTFKPPSISSLTLTYNFTTPEYHLQHCLTYNNFEYVEHVLTSENNNDDNEKYYPPFKPFEPAEDEQPALYLGFDQKISSLPVTLYFSIVEKIVTALESSSKSEALPTLVWKYWDGASWTKFDVEDATRSLTERELAQFLAPARLSSRYLFNLLDQQYYWIRVQIEHGAYRESPRLRGIHLNTVWAYNRVSIHNEILGSGTEKANQTLVLSQSPVFPGQKLLVREPEAPTGEERKEILQNEGDDAIEELFDESGNLTEVWVRWHEVANFYASGPGSRDYVIDHVTGTITFGDGINGMIPPRGRDNIKCEAYQYGGGSVGNVAANAISELRTSIPYIDKVSNPEAAEGGADAETLDEVKERGPQTLKNRDRAVTWEDYEWLVKQVSTAIARVKCLPAKDSKTAGEVRVIVVPDSQDIKPLPNRTLIRQVEDYLYQRGLTTLTSGITPQVRIFGPGYIEISVEATVVPQDINQAPLVESRVRQNLTQFLHPLYGGPEGQGWEFGRDVFISEIYAVIEDTEGVDHVESARFKPSDGTSAEVDRTERQVSIAENYLVYSGSHDITMVPS